MNHDVLEVSELCVSFGRRTVLERVSFGLRRGEHVALIGPNGAGKTTLLRSLAGLCRLQHGAIAVFGKPLPAYDRRALARCVTYVPQQFQAAFRFSVREFVAMARYPHLGPWSAFSAADAAVVEDALARTDSLDLGDRVIAELSGGEKQRVLLSAALAQETPLLLLDEPMNGLDPRHQDGVQELIEGLRKSGEKTVITATHELNSAALTADRLIGLRAGRILFDAPPRECMTRERLAELYDKSFVLVQHPAAGVPMVLPGHSEEPL